jgi:isocitrate/methylisocitrate lyase
VERISQQAARLRKEWETDPRWKDTARTYSAEDVVRLRGTVQEEYTLASACGICWPPRTPSRPSAR